jgi:tetratricopeptide (TPR) repeat protein
MMQSERRNRAAPEPWEQIMVRIFLRSILFGGIAMTAMPEVSVAGMTQDLSDCTAADRKTSAAACTRVMNSGRLPKNQYYIGYYNRAWSHFSQGEYDKSVADFDASLSHNSTYADTYYSRAVAWHERGEREKSLADLDKYLDLKGEVSVAYFKRAHMFRRRGELERAYTEVRRAADLDAKDQKVQVLRALILSDKGEQRWAREDVDKVLAAKPDDAGALYARALISYRENELAKAADDAETAIKQKKDFTAAHTLLGRIREQQGDKAVARASFQRALDIPSKSVDQQAAREEARERMAALGGETVERVAEKSPSRANPSRTGPSDCRRFLPSAGVTVTVDCPK